MAPPPFPMIVGCPRSGTTLVRTLLDSHPDMAIPGESDVTFKILREAATQDGTLAVDRLREILRTSRRLARWGLTPDELLSVAPTSLDRIDGAEAVRRLYGAYARSRGSVRAGDKTPFHARRLRLLTASLPEAVVIHVIRDPRAVALSLGRVSWFDGGAGAAARAWNSHVSRGRADGLNLGSSRYIEIRYEDLVAHPASQLRRLCEVLALRFTEEMLERQESARRAIADTEYPQDHAALTRPIAPRGDWQAELASLEVRRVEALCGDLMVACGYEPTHDPRSAPMKLLRLTDDAATRLRGGYTSTRERVRRLTGHITHT